MCKGNPVAFLNLVTVLIDTLAQAGFEAYAVGGCVRDSLLGKTPADWDICTNALPEQICECFSQYRLIDTGMRHGTVTVVAEHQPFEITTYRVDGAYSDHRRPDCVSFSDSLLTDLARRDFTVNAMACHPQQGLIDVYHGAKDLRDGIIRCVGEPNARFQEDALRILRALRFAAVYGFSIEPHTADAIHTHAPLLAHVAGERVAGELCKLLCGAHVWQILNDFFDVFCTAIPALTDQRQQPDFLKQWRQAAAVIAQAEGNLEIALSELTWLSVKVYDITEEKAAYHAALSWAKALRLDRSTGQTAAMLAVNRETPILPEDAALKRVMGRFGAQQTMLLIAARRARMLAEANLDAAEQMRQARERVAQLLRERACFNRAGLAVRGYDLKEAGISDGKTIGELLDQMVLWVIDGQIDNQKDLLLTKTRERNCRKVKK